MSYGNGVGLEVGAVLGTCRGVNSTGIDIDLTSGFTARGEIKVTQKYGVLKVDRTARSYRYSTGTVISV